MKKNNEIRDIYQGENQDSEADYTPQVTKELIDQRRRDLQRSRITSSVLGGLALVISIALIVLVTRDVLFEKRISQVITEPETSFIPRYNLAPDLAWVMSYSEEQADTELQSLEGGAPLSTKWVKSAAYHIIMGQQALAMNKPDIAQEHLQKVSEIFPEIEGLRRTLGLLKLQEEDFESASQHLELAMIEEEGYETANHLGTAYIGLKKYDSAEKTLLKALELRPENPASHLNLAQLYREMENIPSASFHFEKYIDLRPNDLDALQAYAVFLAKHAQWNKAADFLTQLTEEVTDVAPIYFLLAQVHVQNGKPAKAVDSLQRGIQLIDPSLALAWMSRNEFDTIRETGTFKSLIDQLEIASVSLNDLQ